MPKTVAILWRVRTLGFLLLPRRMLSIVDWRSPDNVASLFKEMGGTYVRCGDYFIPCLTLPEEEEPRFVGVWGQRHLRYLKEYRRNVYLDLLMSGRLNSYLADMEEQAQERFERLIDQMKQAQGITEQLKADNAWEWVGRMNNIQACARETVDREMIYQ